MKLQSAIEFLTTYSFTFIIIGIAIGAILFLAFNKTAVPPTVCDAFGSITCSFSWIYTNSSLSFSTLTISITNDQKAPINITSFNVTLGGLTGPGTCSPNLVYPGEEATCVGVLNESLQTSQLRSGSFSVNSRLCDVGLAYLQNISACTGDNATYQGSFSAYPSTTPEYIFSVIVSKAPSSVFGPPYNYEPIVPVGYTIVQNGDWVANSTASAATYAFGTLSYVGQSFFGVTVSNYPQAVSQLNSQIKCVQPYNSTLEMAYSVIYMPYVSSQVTINVYSSGAIEFYYKPPSQSYWNELFTSAAWNPSSGSVINSEKVFTAKNGLYDIATAWANACSNGGVVQAVTLSGI